MSRRLDVLAAVKKLVSDVLPGAQVVGLDGEEAAPARVPAGGRVVVRTGDPGSPEIDLSPLAYNWTHRIPLEVSAYQSGGRTSEEALDDMLTAIGAAVAGNRHLGGLCDWLDAQAALTDDIYVENAAPPRGADLVLIASYQTSNPLD